MSVNDGLAFVGLGPRLVILDIADPVNPRLVGQSEVLPEAVNAIYVQVGYAYAAPA